MKMWEDAVERLTVELAAVRESEAALKKDILAGLRAANALTLETQTVEEACTDLVRLVRKAREERDEAQAFAQKIERENPATEAVVAFKKVLSRLDGTCERHGPYRKDEPTQCCVHHFQKRLLARESRE